MTLIPNWRHVLRWAWSIRFNLLDATFTALFACTYLLLDDYSPTFIAAYVGISLSLSIGATVSRLIAQPKLHEHDQ
jgi:hypothetical protein